MLNCGSSSVKLRLVDTAASGWLLRGLVDRIGEDEPGACVAERAGSPAERHTVRIADHGAALDLLLQHLPEAAHAEAVGHRVVHGGERYTSAARITETMLPELEALSRLAPLHNPPNLQGIRVARERWPLLPHVAAFDTAFHATLPDFAYRYAVPESWYRELGIRRYGFHGLSHQYVAEQAAALTGRTDLRLVSLHLGNGASAAAIRGRTCVDTSMGLTPLEGLVMGTRTGDLDPSIPLLVQGELGLSAAAVDRILNRESGLEGFAGTHDMRDIEAQLERSAGARLAFEAFCYRARKYVGAYAAALGGLDALAFTAGIGENSSRTRREICRGLQFLGLRLDEAANGEYSTTARDVADPSSAVRVLVIPTDEERVIARETEAVLRGGVSAGERECC